MFGSNFNLAKEKGRREEKTQREGLLAERRDGEKERGNC